MFCKSLPQQFLNMLLDYEQEHCSLLGSPDSSADSQMPVLFYG